MPDGLPGGKSMMEANRMSDEVRPRLTTTTHGNVTLLLRVGSRYLDNHILGSCF